MTRRLPCPVAPGPLEGYAVRFDDLFGSLAQRRGFRGYLAGLLAPRDRNKTLTALAGAEPVAGAQHRSVQRLQFFLSESRWDPGRVNARRLELLAADPAAAPHEAGVLVIDDSGDRKDGVKTAHVGRQWLGRYGKTDNGVVTVTTVWADERLYYPVHAVPYTPARHFAKGKNDPAFRTKLAIGAGLAIQARQAGFAFRAVVADSAYGDQDGFRGELAEAGLPFVMALRPRRGTWARAADVHTPVEAARALAWGGPDDPGDWTAVRRTFRDGHAETWWAADATLVLDVEVVAGLGHSVQADHGQRGRLGGVRRGGQVDALGLRMIAQQSAERRLRQARHQGHALPEPGQADRDVVRAPARDGEVAVRLLARDEIDDCLADDRDGGRAP